MKDEDINVYTCPLCGDNYSPGVVLCDCYHYNDFPNPIWWDKYLPIGIGRNGKILEFNQAVGKWLAETELEKTIIEMGNKCAVSITGNPEDGNITDVKLAIKTIEEALVLGQKASEERNYYLFQLNKAVDILTSLRNYFWPNGSWRGTVNLKGILNVVAPISTFLHNISKGKHKK